MDNPISMCEFPIGCVRYIERLSEKVPIHNSFLPYMFKDNSYKWENEIRILRQERDLYEKVLKEFKEAAHRDDLTDTHIYCRVDPTVLIEKIYTGPL
ncbi:MAG: hypothetical protein R3A13_06955 [Bdellovibrionota bacterium]